jgi:hypothetical protein
MEAGDRVHFSTAKSFIGGLPGREKLFFEAAGEGR